MKIGSLFILLLTCSLFSFAQPEKLNQLDASGKRTGTWLIFLDKDWRRIDDSTKAVYCRYTVYDKGTNLFPMGPCAKKGYRLEIPDSDKIMRGKLVLLNGEYKWYDSKGKLSSTHLLKNGTYIFCKEYYSSGQIKHNFEFARRWNNQPNTWFVTIYDKKGNVKLVDCMKPDDKGNWPHTSD